MSELSNFRQQAFQKLLPSIWANILLPLSRPRSSPTFEKHALPARIAKTQRASQSHARMAQCALTLRSWGNSLLSRSKNGPSASRQTRVMNIRKPAPGPERNRRLSRDVEKCLLDSVDCAHRFGNWDASFGDSYVARNAGGPAKVAMFACWKRRTLLHVLCHSA